MKNNIFATTSRCTLSFFLIVSLAGLVAIPSAMAAERTDGMRFVPDVVNQFKSLAVYAEPLGFYIGDTPNPSECRHYQGLARVAGADGTPYLMVSQSGSIPKIFDSQTLGNIVCDSPSEVGRNGHLVVFRAGSRDKNGERLRSNRLSKGHHVSSTAPPIVDIAPSYYTVVGGDPDDPDPSKRPDLVFEDGPAGQILPRVYQHPGSMQAVGNILAVAADGPRGYSSLCNATQSDALRYNLLQQKLEQFPNYCTFEKASEPTIVMFLDISDPENPVYKSSFTPTKEDGVPLSAADAFGLTALPGDRYLLVVSGGFEGNRHHYFRSTSGNLASPDLSWERIGATSGPSTGNNVNQSLNFVRQRDIDGPLFIAAARGHIVVDIGVTKLYTGKDRIALYRIKCQSPTCEPGEPITLTDEVSSQKLNPFPSVGGSEIANLAAASGFYVSPTGELLFYAFNHDNNGKNGTAQAGEWRHEKVTRLDSPTLLPTITLNGPYDVNEGDTVNLSGSAVPPYTKAWMQPVGFTGQYPVVDFTDRALDDYDDIDQFAYFDLADIFDINFRARQWSWYAPVGCSIQTLDNQDNVLRTVAGTGYVNSDDDLSLVLNDAGTDDINEQIDEVKFLDNCSLYYNTGVDLGWDLDVSGTYESIGNTVVYSAVSADGPSVISVPVQARHPSGGRINQVTADVTIHNVEPIIEQFLLLNDSGQLLNIDIPFVLTGQVVTADAEFSDPGVLDHQTATLNWGDGLVESEADFTTFSDAFGGSIGTSSHTHSYQSSGLYVIMFNALDDDDGVGGDSALLSVKTPQEAVESVINMLEQSIANANSDAVRDDLKRALKSLIGSVLDTSENGALNMMKAGHGTVAGVFFQQSIFWLNRAEEGGADTAIIVELLEQVIIALN
jgi:hypothetical protein